MENKSLNNLDLPFKLWPGTAIANKLILNDRTVKKTIIQELLGNEDFSVHEGLVLLREIAFRLGTDNESYRSAWTEWPDGTYSDVLYVPGRVTEDRPPVLVEIQDTVDQAFMLRLIQHCTLVVERYKVLPVVLVLVTVGFSQQTLRGKLIPHSKVHYLLEAKCEFLGRKKFLARIS